MTKVEPVLMARKRLPSPVSKVSAPASRAAPRDARMRNEERYALAMQSINYGVYDADLEGGEVYFSTSLRAMLGMKPDDPALTTGNIIEKIHPADQPVYREAIVRHLKQETPQFVCDFRYIATDESWRWARQHGVAVRHPDGRAYRIVGAMTDVTESRAARPRAGHRAHRGADDAPAKRCR